MQAGRYHLTGVIKRHIHYVCVHPYRVRTAVTDGYNAYESGKRQLCVAVLPDSFFVVFLTYISRLPLETDSYERSSNDNGNLFLSADTLPFTAAPFIFELFTNFKNRTEEQN